MDDAGLWPEIDGMLLLQSIQWWNDEGEVLDMTKSILNEYRPDEAEAIIRSGGGYLKMQQLYIMFELISDTVEEIGPKNFSSQAGYDTAKSFSIDVDGCPHSYTDTKRVSNDALASFEVRANEKDIFRRESGPKWYPVLNEP